MKTAAGTHARESFLRASLSAALPMGLWAAHFVLCYAGVLLGCHAGWDAPWLMGTSMLRAGLLITSAAAIAAAVVLLVRAWRGRRRGLVAGVRWIGSLIALAGIVWTSAPLLWLSTCRAG